MKLAMRDAQAGIEQQHLADLSRLPRQIQVRRVPYLGCHGEANRAFEKPILAGLPSAVLRHQERVAQLKERVLVGEFAGAAGTVASLETGAIETQAGLCAELGLQQPVIAWHTIRDNIAEVGTVLGLIGGTLPPGLELRGSYPQRWIEIVGTPTALGVYGFSLQVEVRESYPTDSGPTLCWTVDERRFQITVEAAPT